MKKALCLALALICVGMTALAAPQLRGGLFNSAKQAVQYLSSGEYERLVTLLPFSDIPPSASEWESFAGNFSNLSRVQTEYAVAYWTGSVWKIAVPLQAPDDGSVEVLVLTSEDGSSFSGYRYATWSHVEAEYSASAHVQWDSEYVGGSPTVVAD